MLTRANKRFFSLERTNMTEFKTVSILGGGVLGSQIAMQAAYHGKDVLIYDPFQESLDKLPARWEWMRAGYEEDLEDLSLIHI